MFASHEEKPSSYTLGTLISSDNSVEKEIYKDVFWPAIEPILSLLVSSGVDFYPELLKLYCIRC